MSGDDVQSGGLNHAERRLAGMIAAAIDALSPEDRAAREAWCAAAGGRGVSSEEDSDGLTVWWGGRRLLAVSWAALHARDDAAVSIACVPYAPGDASELA